MSATHYPFPRCEKGHDLTGDGAFLYDSSGNRKCRVCASDVKRKEKQVKGAFEGGMGR